MQAKAFVGKMLSLLSMGCGMHQPPGVPVQQVFLIQTRAEREEEGVTLREHMYGIIFVSLGHPLST